ncbi:MAG: AraC family transcriptional regulator [Clostridia bacterium]|nr:AraC family transcriptional regulator [Clostridia bacterium]
MNWFNDINLILDEIEKSLTEKIEYNKLAMKIGISENTLMKVFSFIVQIPIGEYVRKRRLTEGYKEIIDGKSKIIDIAIKYNYNSEYAFLRVLKNEFGIDLEEIKKNNKSVMLLEKYDISNNIIYHNLNENNGIFDYEIIEKDVMIFYGKHRKISKIEINKEARNFFYEESKTLMKIQEKESGYLGIGNYNYVDNIEKVDFYIAGKHPYSDLEEIQIKRGKWAVFKIKSNPENQADDMYNLIRKVYDVFLNKYSYKLSKDRPCIEYYYTDNIEFWLSIDL